MNPQSRVRVLAAVYAAGIVIVSLLPAGAGVGLWNLDKVGHFLAYAGLGLLVSLSFERAGARVAALIGAIALGALLEWGQSFVPGRQMSLADEIVNALGVVTGALIFRFKADELRRWAKTH